MKTSHVRDAVSLPVPVATIGAGAPVAEALRVMRAAGVHHLVVRDGAAILGVVSDRNIYAGATVAGGTALDSEVEVGSVMVRLDAFVTESSTLSHALELLAASGASALPVVGPLGLKGIITETDLLRVFGVLLAADDGVARGRAGGTVMLSNPLIQEAMRLLAQAGV